MYIYIYTQMFSCYVVIVCYVHADVFCLCLVVCLLSCAVASGKTSPGLRTRYMRPRGSAGGERSSKYMKQHLLFKCYRNL